MCGFLYALGKNSPIPQDKLQYVSNNFIAPRGPTRRLEYSSQQEYACQSILSVQSSPDTPSNVNQLGSNHFILYNGEIFDSGCSSDFIDDDTLLINDLSTSGCLKNKLHNFDGMFAIAEIFNMHCHNSSKPNSREIWLHRDLSGEKHVYYWYNEKLFVASSSPGAIGKLLQSMGLLHINESQLIEYIARRHYISNEDTCFAGMKQVLPGHSVNFSSDKWHVNSKNPFDSLESLFDKPQYDEFCKYSNRDYAKKLDNVLNDVAINYHKTNHTGSSALVISGGIDSSLFSYYLKENSVESHTTESFVGIFGKKDLSALKAKDLSNSIGILNHYDVDINEKLYAESLERCIEILAAPVHTHSLPSSRLLGDFVAAKGHKVMYGGEGADELFLGYKTYLDLYRNGKKEKLGSAYTKKTTTLSEDYSNDELELVMSEDIKLFEDKFRQLGANQLESYIKANALLDYKYQLPMVGLIASDTVISDCGVEYRTPFTRKSVLKFAINSPLQKLINSNDELSSKSPLTNLYRKKFKQQQVDPKIGFSGFPNESRKFLPSLNNWKVFDLFPFLRQFYGKSQAHDWKIINIEWFLNVWNLC